MSAWHDAHAAEPDVVGAQDVAADMSGRGTAARLDARRRRRTSCATTRARDEREGARGQREGARQDATYPQDRKTQDTADPIAITKRIAAVQSEP